MKPVAISYRLFLFTLAFINSPTGYMYPTPQLEHAYQDEFISVQLDKHLSLIYVEWFKHPQSHEFREVFQQLADLTLASNSKYWLSDPRSIHYIELADQNWLLREMAPLLKQSNLLKFARLITTENLEMMDIVRLYDRLEKSPDLQITTKFELFTNKEDAFEWLFADL